MRAAALVASVGTVADGMRFLRSRDPLEQMLMPVLAEQAAERAEVRMANAYVRAQNGDG